MKTVEFNENDCISTPTFVQKSVVESMKEVGGYKSVKYKNDGVTIFLEMEDGWVEVKPNTPTLGSGDSEGVFGYMNQDTSPKVLLEKYLPEIKKMSKEDFLEVEERLVNNGMYFNKVDMKKDECFFYAYSFLNGLFLDGADIVFEYYNALKELGEIK